MKLNFKSTEDRLYALRVMLGEDVPIKVLNEDIESIVDGDISFDVLNDNVDYINYVAKEDIVETMELMISESNKLDGGDRICFVIDDIFIKNKLFKKYIISLNEFGLKKDVNIDLILESPSVIENAPLEMSNIEIWYGVDTSGKVITSDIEDSYLCEYIQKHRLFEIGIKKYLTFHTPKLIIASTPSTIVALDSVSKDIDIECFGLIKFGNVYNFKKDGVFKDALFEDYFVEVLNKTSIPLAVENKEFYKLVNEIVGDGRRIIELPSPNEISEELLGLAYSDASVFIEDNNHISEDTYNKMFSILAPIGLVLTVATTADKEALIIEMMDKHHIGKYNVITNKDEMFYKFIKDSHKVFIDLSEDSANIDESIFNSERSILNNSVESSNAILVNPGNTIECIKKVISLIGNPYNTKNEFKDIMSDYDNHIDKTWGIFLGDADED